MKSNDGGGSDWSGDAHSHAAGCSRNNLNRQLFGPVRTPEEVKAGKLSHFQSLRSHEFKAAIDA